jgi:rod shape-determining protein MreC
MLRSRLVIGSLKRGCWGKKPLPVASGFFMADVLWLKKLARVSGLSVTLALSFASASVRGTDIKSLFIKESDVGLRLLVLVVVSLVLIFTDINFRQTDMVRSKLTTLVTPIQYVVDIPSRVMGWLNSTTVDYQALYEENDGLKAQALVLQRKLQKMTALTAENIRLRELLNSAEKINDNVMLAAVIGVDPNPFTQEVVINKGSNEKVRVGQPLLDSSGVMGQVVSVSRFSSRVLLLSDSRHSIPVQINRNGIRAILVGTGVGDKLDLLHFPDTADIVEGDVLVTSGLGGRFPFGYPVATVGRVGHDPGQPFASIQVRPSAQLNRSRQVMLVMTRERVDKLNGTNISGENETPRQELKK